MEIRMSEIGPVPLFFVQSDSELLAMKTESGQDLSVPFLIK